VQYNPTSSARKIAEALGGSRIPDAKGNYLCRCPSHLDRHPSLAVCNNDGKLLFHCRAGCRQDAVLAALKRLGLLPGRSDPAAQTATQPALVQPLRPTRPPPDPFKMWREASPFVANSLVELYLRNRGLEIPADPPLRCARALWHPLSKSRHPAMVALIERYDGTAITSHATFLSPDGRKASVQPVRLFPAGASPAGGGVWFDRLGSKRELAIAEGIESALSAALLYDAEAAVATLSTHGMRTLLLAPLSRQPVRIVADHDAQGHGLAAARDLYRRLRSEGREVVVTLPDNVGDDANTILMRRVRA
jgi:putative DNA primase/helicase